jgi:site-specific DNA recombinase
VKAIGYVRVSTENQAKESISLNAQIAKVKAYASERNWDLEIIKDEGRSGRDWNREGAKLLWASINQNSVSDIIVYKLDRLSRSALDLSQIGEELNKRGIRLHSIRKNVDTTSSMGRFFFRLIGEMVGLDRKRVSVSTRAALIRKKARGEWIGRIPFGFKLEDGVLVENPEQMEIIRKAKKARREGVTFRELARRFGIDKMTLFRAIRRLELAQKESTLMD